MNKRLLTLCLLLTAIVTSTKAQSDSETMLTLEALETTTVTIKNPREITSFYYQKNDEASGVVLTTVPFATNVTEISLDKGDKLKLFGIWPQYGASEESESTNINCSGYCYIYGNIMSLFDVNTFPVAKVMNYDYTFAHLFKGNTHIKNHPSKALVLPATTLTEYCYSEMFRSCTGLTEAPDLPATTLAAGCYKGMFIYCTTLEAAPALPAIKLVDKCYERMFQMCYKLNNVYCMAGQLGETYALDWLAATSSSGTFTKNLFATVEKLTKSSSGVPFKWTLSSDAPGSVRYDFDCNGRIDAADITKLVDYIMHH
jgi:hypothetical protein